MLKRYLLVCALSFGLLQAVAAQAVEDEDFGLMTSERIGPFRIGMPDDEVLKATNCVFRRGEILNNWVTGGYRSDWESEGCGTTLGMESDTPRGVQRIERIILSDTGKFKTARGVGIGSFGHEAGAYSGASKRRIGKIEYANGGTLFLDEIETIPVPMQIKLLRVLQERTLERLGSNTSIPIDCRIIAATKADLAALAEQGRFRADLYYRLSVAPLPLPPLRERREDIPLLFEHFLLQASVRHERPVPQMSSGRIQQLVAYGWPGNVRELRNVADRCVLGIEAGSPPFGQVAADTPRPLTKTVEDFERALIADALRRHGSLSRTAEALSIAKTTLYDKIRKYGLGDIS